MVTPNTFSRFGRSQGAAPRRTGPLLAAATKGTQSLHVHFRIQSVSMDEGTVVMVALGVIITLAASLGAVAVWQRMPKSAPRAEAEDDEPDDAGRSPSKKKNRSRRGKSSVSDNYIEDSARASLPEISVGTRCWHRQAKEWCKVCKVYYDNLPPYYSVTMADGAERATVRARLDTEEERNAIIAAEERAVAEERSDAAAAALLAEEEKEPRRKPISEGKGSSGKAKRR